MQKAIVRLAPELLARDSLWSTGFMRVLRIDDLNDAERLLFTQPMALARLGRYVIDIERARQQVGWRVWLWLWLWLWLWPCCHALVPNSNPFHVFVFCFQSSKRKWAPKPLVVCALDKPTRQYTVVGLPWAEEEGGVEKT